MGLDETQKKERSDYLEQNLKITECSQKKPYAFISYASDNWETVFKNAVVPMQMQYGLCVYADKAFDKVNDKWIVPMLRNVRGSDVMIAFVSQSYIESYACFLELLTAVNNKKQIVFVSLEQKLHLGDTTDQPNIERGVKNEILNQGANIATNTNNSSNDVMRAMKSAYTSISTLLEQDALSKYDITDAFINFFNDASINRKTINDLHAVKRTINSISSNVFDKSMISTKSEHNLRSAASGVSAQPVIRTDEPVRQTAEPAPTTDNVAKPKLKIDVHSKKIKTIIAAAVCCITVIGIILGINAPRNVTNMSYSSNMLKINDVYPYTDGTYTGRWHHNMPNGEGTLIFTTGDSYEGEWVDGKATGQGTMTYADGTVYEGEWANGKATGQGAMTYANGDVYEGEWINGMRSGQGTMTYVNGDVYKGEWTDDSTNGQGTCIYANGDVYEGEWINGMRSGQGILTYVNGNVYEGEWADGEINGQGTMTYANGDVFIYEGEWLDGNANGQGTCTYANGDVYEGEWADGYQNGQGTMTGANGDVYEGEWADGEINGQGTMTGANGRVYEGEWASGTANGQGTMTYPNGNVYTGEWKDGRLNGQGTMTYADGTVQTGTWQDGEFVD